MVSYETWVTSPIEGPIDPDCQFCDISRGVERSLFDRAQPIGEGDVYITPTVGMMVPGYFLAVTRRHDTSFAQRDPRELAAIDEQLTRVTDKLSDRFGAYFRVEHGSDNIDACGSGGCIDHAHIHLIPADEDVGEHVLGQLPWQTLESYAALEKYRGEPYIYLGRTALDGKSAARHYVLPNPRLPSQWIRRQIAAVRGPAVQAVYGERYFEETIGDDADWALHPGVNSLVLTMCFLGAVPRGRGVLTMSGREPDFQPSDAFHRYAGTQPWVD